MQDPEKQLNDYLDRVTGEIGVLKENLLALKSIVDGWNQQGSTSIVEIYGYLLGSLYNLLFDNLILNLGWLFDKKGDRSLIRYLNQMNEQSENFLRELATKRVDYEPPYFHTTQSIEAYQQLKNLNDSREVERENQINHTIKKFKAEIVTDINDINNMQEKYQQLKTIRDKSIAHRDKVFFDGPVKFWSEAQLTVDDIESLTNLAISIVKKHY